MRLNFQTMKYFGYALFIIGFVNFAVFWIVAAIIGGDAVGNGPINGKYYVSSHGHQIEVSRSVYEYSWYHSRSIWITHPLAFFGWFLVYDDDQRRKSKPIA